MDTLDDLENSVDETETDLKSSKEPFNLLKNEVAKPSSKFIEKNTSLSCYRDRVVVLEKDLVNASAEVDCLNTQQAFYNGLRSGVRSALPFHKRASQQRAAADANDCEKLSGNNAGINTKFSKFWKNIQAMNDLIKASLDDMVKCCNALRSVCVKFPVCQKSIKRQL